MSPEKLRYYHAQAAKVPLNRKWQWMATWPLVYRFGDHVELVLEHACLQYRVDIYIPSLQLAIEIDEAHHDRQVEQDARRQLEIGNHLGCTFRRLRVVGGESSLYTQLTSLFDELDRLVQPLPAWGGPPVAQRVGRAARALTGGSYSEEKRQRLLDAGIPELVQDMLNDLAAVGIETDTDDIKPLEPSNGELGFAVLMPGARFVVSVSPTRRIKTLITADWETTVPGRLGLVLEGPKGGSVPYWNVAGMTRKDLSIEETLKKLIQFNDILRTPGARAAAETES